MQNERTHVVKEATLTTDYVDNSHSALVTAFASIDIVRLLTNYGSKYMSNPRLSDYQGMEAYEHTATALFNIMYISTDSDGSDVSYFHLLIHMSGVHFNEDESILFFKEIVNVTPRAEDLKGVTSWPNPKVYEEILNVLSKVPCFTQTGWFSSDSLGSQGASFQWLFDELNGDFKQSGWVRPETISLCQCDNDGRRKLKTIVKSGEEWRLKS